MSKIKKILLSLTVAFLVTIPLTASAAELDIPCRPSSGTGAQSDLFNCVNSLYKYALVIASITAVIMIIFAGYMYIFSGGSDKKVSTAKAWITSSLLGITVLLTGFLLLKQINPSLLTIKNISPEQVAQTTWFPFGPGDTGGIGGYGPTGGGQSGNVQGNGVTCNGGKDTRTNEHTNCNCYSAEVTAAASEFGIEAALIRAVIQIESNCNPNAHSRANAYGIMQIIPGTANGLGCAQGWQTNPKENIRCGAKYLSLIKKRMGDVPIKYILSGYNAGEGARSQGPSEDCPGMRKWECPFADPGHTRCDPAYDETRNYAVAGSRFYQEAQACH